MVVCELACYTINSDGWDGCLVCFTTRECVTRDNHRLLDGAVVKITAVFTSDHENWSMQRLYHYNRGYAYAVVESVKTNN